MFLSKIAHKYFQAFQVYQKEKITLIKKREKIKLDFTCRDSVNTLHFIVFIASYNFCNKPVISFQFWCMLELSNDNGLIIHMAHMKIQVKYEVFITMKKLLLKFVVIFSKIVQRFLLLLLVIGKGSTTELYPQLCSKTFVLRIWLKF